MQSNAPERFTRGTPYLGIARTSPGRHLGMFVMCLCVTISRELRISDLQELRVLMRKPLLAAFSGLAWT